MADLKQFEGDYITCELLLTKTLPHLKKIKRPRFTANIYESFAANYYYLYDYNNALLYLTKVLHLKLSAPRKIRVLSSICQIYIKQKKFKLAESILVPLSKIKTIGKNDKFTNDAEYSRILDNLGLCYQAQLKPEALDCYKKSIASRLLTNDKYGLLYNYMHVAEYYQESNPIIAVYYAKKALVLSNQFHDASTKLQILNILNKTSEGNDLKKYSANFIQLVDSVAKARQTTKNEFTNVKYNFQTNRDENLQLKELKANKELQLERQKRRNIYLYMIIVVVLSLIAFVYFYLKTKGTKQKKNAVFESEISISQKLSDELTNDVYHSLIFAETVDLEKRENKEKLLHNLQTIYTKTRNISKENSSIPTNENYGTALKEMISNFQTAELSILFNGFDSILWNKMDNNIKTTLYRALYKLLLLSKKHAKTSLIGISFKKTNTKILIHYTDNGIDVSDAAFKNELHNVESRILNVKGAIIIDSANGKNFKVVIKLPLR